MRRSKGSEESRLLRNPLEAPVGVSDDLVVARTVSLVVLSAFAALFRAGDGTAMLAAVLVLLAVAQPLLAVVWPRRTDYLQAQGYSDIASFAAFAFIAPSYYTLSSIVLVAVVSVHAILAVTRSYVSIGVAALATMTVCGVIQEIDDWERIVLVALVVMVGHGYLGHRARSVTSDARDDLLLAITQAGGLAHLTEMDGGIIDIIGDVHAVTGWDRDTWTQANHADLIHPDDLDEFWIDRDGVQEGLLFDRVARFRRPDGRWIWIRDMSRVVIHGGRPHLRGFWIDVSAEYDGLERVSAEASTDELTGLPNRRSLLAELKRRQGDGEHRLVLIDLNRFKDVNDTLGHDAGDELLRAVADRLARCIGPHDVLARLGGDEFAVVVGGGVDSETVTTLVGRLAFEVSRPVEVSGVSLTVTMSAGIACSTDGDASSTTMLRHADIAMYAAKRMDETSREFDAAMGAESDLRATLSAGLTEALATGELALHFQPIVDIVAGRIVALEGLARWDHPLFGRLDPDSFLDVTLMSESSGRFTQVMIHRAIEAISCLVACGRPMPVAVNVPIRVIEDAGFSEWVGRACVEANVEPGLLVFEVAEADLHDTTSMTRAIDRLTAMDVTISIDDFGAGNASFERLRWRNVEQLKLDRSVVQDAAAQPRARTILRSILALADQLGYEVVAEGVESHEQLELLRSLGCRLAQGFHLARPVPLADVLELLALEGSGGLTMTIAHHEKTTDG